MQGRCDKHLFEQAVDVCRACGYEFCNDCLVYAFGPKQPPFCVNCAVAAAGIRRAAGNPPSMKKADRKRMLKERKSFMAQAAREAKAASKALRRGGGQLAPDLVGTPVSAPVTDTPGVAAPVPYTPAPQREATSTQPPMPVPALAYDAPAPMPSYEAPMVTSRPSFEEAAVAAAATPEPAPLADEPISSMEWTDAEVALAETAPPRRVGHPIGFPWVQPEIEPRRAAG